MYDFSGACSHILPALKHLAATGRKITRELQFGKLLYFHVDQTVSLDEARHLAVGLTIDYDFLAPGACDGLHCCEHHQTIRWPSGEAPAMICEHLLPILRFFVDNGERVSHVQDDDGDRVWSMWANRDITGMCDQMAVHPSLTFYEVPAGSGPHWPPLQGFMCYEHRHVIYWTAPFPQRRDPVVTTARHDPDRPSAMAEHVCEHLQPAVRYLASQGLAPSVFTPLGSAGLVLRFPVSLDPREIMLMVSPEPCVVIYKERRTWHWDQGLRCMKHHHAVLWPSIDKHPGRPA